MPNFNASILDRPDLTVRRAALKTQLGIQPSERELRRLANRMSIEEETARQNMPNGADQATALRAANPGGIDVRSYSGSIYGGNMTAIPGYRPPMNFEATADALLRSEYGAPPNERGVIDIAGAGGTRSVPGGLQRPAAMAQPGLPTMPTLTPAASTPGGGVYDLLGGTRADPRFRAESANSRSLEDQARSVQIQGEQERLLQNATNAAAARKAIGPIAVPGTVRPRTPAEGQYIARDRTIQDPPTTRDPNGDEILRNYIAAGGRADPSLLIAAGRPQRGERSPSVIQLQDSTGNMVNYAWDGANLQRIDAHPTATKPVPGAGGTRVVDLPGVGKMVVDATTGAPIPSGNIVKPAAAGAKIDPMLVGTIQEQIAKLNAEKLQHQQAMAGGDERYGFGNISSRTSRIAEIDQKLTGLQATLNAGAGTSRDSTGSPQADSGPAAPGAKKEKSAAAQTYNHADIQAEMRRRKLIQ